jgi:predicted DNA-binding mobile mystery protein A
MKTNCRLIRQQLDSTLKKFQPLRAASIPAKGWIRAIRDALGMTCQQLGHRLGLSKQRAAFIEKQELDGTATLKTMRRIAEALDCVFVYGFVPRTSLEKTVLSQAESVAARQLGRAAHTMSLEDQSLGDWENQESLIKLAQKLVDTPPKNLWE